LEFTQTVRRNKIICKKNFLKVDENKNYKKIVKNYFKKKILKILI